MALDLYNKHYYQRMRKRFHLPIVGQMGLEIAFESSFFLSLFYFKNEAILKFQKKVLIQALPYFKKWYFSTS